MAPNPSIFDRFYKVLRSGFAAVAKHCIPNSFLAFLGGALSPLVGGQVQFPTGGGGYLGQGHIGPKVIFLRESLISKGGVIKGGVIRTSGDGIPRKYMNLNSFYRIYRKSTKMECEIVVYLLSKSRKPERVGA